MAQRLSKIWTFGKALYHMTMRLKEYTDETITPQGWCEIFNLKLFQAQGILNLKNLEEYKEPVVLSLSPYAPGGVITLADTFNTTTKILTIDSFSGWSPSFTDFDETNPVGARVFFHNNGGINEGYVTEKIDANSIRITNYGDNTAPGDVMGILVLPGNEAVVNIGLFPIYKNIREIALIESNLHGECVNKPKAEWLGITNPPIGTYHSHWKKRIIWTRDGELIKFGFGDITSPGTMTMWVLRTPYECNIDSPDEYLDARDDDMNIIFDMCLLTGLETLKIPIPSNLKSTEEQINKLITANEAQKAKLLTGKE